MVEEAVVTEVCVGAASPPPGAEHLQLSVRLLTPEPANSTPQSPNTNSSDTDNVPLGGGGLKEEGLGGLGMSGGAVVGEDGGGGRGAPAAPAAPGAAPAGPPGPFACIHCAAPFPTRDQLEKHELLHSPNAQVSCKVCNKTFANVYRLQRHMISHDESAVLRKFKCPECDKAFKFKHHLKEHIRIHSGEKPFECGNCGKRFSHSGSYSSHMTSKKCLVMNLKVSQRQQGGGGPARGGEHKGAAGGGYRGPSALLKRANNNNNNFPPLVPKYSDTTAFLTGFPPPPFYLNPAGFVGNPPSPYGLPSSLNRLLEQLTPPQPSHEAKPAEEEPPETPPPRVKEEPEEEERRSENSPGVGGNGGDLETVKRILETVNANVTKEFLAANVQKLSSNSCSSGCPSVASGAPTPPPHEEQGEFTSAACRYCHKNFTSRIDLHQHERYLCQDEKSEGLAAKLEDVASVTQEDANGNLCSASEDETNCGSNNMGTEDEETEHDQDGRKVRVRSQIADEQLQILKGYYAVNPRPKREELARIAERVGFPVRVVQVWFQNTRARDRREGRFVQVPYAAPPGRPLPVPSEQPLDLSTKRAPVHPTSSPDSSPHRSDSEDSRAVNLTARKPPPLLDSRLARILTQPHGVMLYANRDHQFVRSPVHGIAVHNGSFSPPSEKRTWRQQCTMDFPDYTDEAEDSAQDTDSMTMTTMDSPPPTSFGLPLGLTNSQHQMQHHQIQHQMQQGEQQSPMATKRAKRATANSTSELDGQFNCDQCDKTFAKHSSLARHKYEHSGQRPHKCDLCTRAFKHKHHLTEHKRLHSGEKPFECSKCHKRFSHSGSFSQHMSHRFSYCKPYRE